MQEEGMHEGRALTPLDHAPDDESLPGEAEAGSSAPTPTDDVVRPPEPGPAAEAEAELRTFLIADIRGYTTFTTEHGADAAAELAGRFAAIVREVVTLHDGFLLELRGDEALAVFVLARRALRAALELQIRFAAELPRGVGIGLDAGERSPSRAAIGVRHSISRRASAGRPVPARRSPQRPSSTSRPRSTASAMRTRGRSG